MSEARARHDARLRIMLAGLITLLVLWQLAVAARDRWEVDPLDIRRPQGPEAPGDCRIDLNTADLVTLEHLPGIGKKRAADIIARRQAIGGFKRIEDLADIPGIKGGTISKLAAFAKVVPLPETKKTEPPKPEPEKAPAKPTKGGQTLASPPIEPDPPATEKPEKPPTLKRPRPTRKSGL
jgi:competence protein ComEA